MIYPIQHLPDSIPLGIQTEKGVQEIGFDVKPWLDAWDGLELAVYPTRPGESAAYPAADVKLIGTVLYWYPNDADTAIAGEGKVEIVGVTADKRKLSGATRTVVAPTSMSATQEPPEGIAPWYESIMHAGHEAKVEAKKHADEAAEFAREAAQTAKEIPDMYVITAAYNDAGVFAIDRTPNELKHAYAQGKILVLKMDNTAAFFNGYEEIADGVHCMAFFYDVHLDEEDGAARIMAYIKPDGSVVIKGNNTRIPNPHALTLTGAVNATYDGSTAVTVEIPEGEGGGNISDPSAAHQQLVSNAEGKATWEERTHYKETTTAEVENLAETALMFDETEQDPVAFLMSPWAVDPVVGGVYDVVYNGTAYKCVGIDLSTIESGDPAGSVLLGNLDAIGITGVEGANADAPFYFMCVPNAMQASYGMYGIFVPLDGATSATISMSGVVATTTYKKMDAGYLPDNIATHNPITMTISEDGTVTVDNTFDEAWALDAGELQASLIIKEPTTSYKGECYASVVRVTKSSGSVRGDTIIIYFGKSWVDVSDLGDPDAMREIMWSMDTGAALSDYASPMLPWLENTSSYEGRYLRFVGGRWLPVPPEDVREDILGDVKGITSIEQTTTSTADGGSNVITATLSDGTTSAFTIRNGNKGTDGKNGKDGYSPVRGTDYWTAEDIATIKAYVDDAILNGAW